LTDEVELLDIYYKDLSKVKILPRKEEDSLLKEYHDYDTSETRKQALKSRILESNLRLVFSMAKTMWDRKDPELLSELIANGNIGLVLALDKFNPNYGTRFCTYAGHWVMMTMRKTFTGLVRTPAAKPQSQYEDEASLSEGSYEVDLLEDLEAQQRRVISQIWLRFLSNRERYIVTRSFSLHDPGSKASSLRSMSRDLGLSSERVRQIRATALSKLRLWLTYHYPQDS
jgi:RNA polymerase sigma factor (sigma-70 family)